MLTHVLHKVAGLTRRARSPRWREARKKWLREHPRCAACATVEKIEVHHVQPFHVHPELELDPANFITLCEAARECHLHVGHLGNWKLWNPLVRQQARTMLAATTGGDPHGSNREGVGG